MKKKYVKTVAKDNDNKGKYRRGKPRNAQYTEPTTDVIEKEKGDVYNAPEWYGAGQPVIDAASLAYSNPLGDPLQISTYLQNNATKLTQSIILPGIMAIGIQPLLYANDGTDALATIQTVSQKIYSFVRHANSGSKNYERSDLMMYLGAVSEIYSLIAWATLAYGLCYTYEQKNKYYGKALVDALGFDYDDITSNLSDFRAYINTIIQIVNTFYVPKGLTYIDRKINLYSHIIKDADDPKGCVYLFRPESFLKWSGSTYKSGTSLDWVNTSQDDDSDYTADESLFNKSITFDDFKTLASILVNAISDDEDAGVISGDILKAYKDAGGVRTISLLPTEFKIAPTYDIEALEIINNLTFVGTPVKGTGDDIDPDITDTYTALINVNCTGVFQRDNQIISNPFFGGANIANSADYFTDAASAYYGPIFSIHSNPSPELNMVVSRLKACTTYNKTQSAGGYFYNYYTLLEAGSEVCTRMRMYINDPSMPSAALETKGVCVGTGLGINRLIGNLVTFDWHPIMYNKVASSSSADVSTLIYEFDNYTVEKPSTIRKMNRVALMAMFGVLADK